MANEKQTQNKAASAPAEGPISGEKPSVIEPIAALPKGNAKPFRWASDVLVLAIAALVLSWPLFVHGPMLSGHDTKEHINFGKYFAEQFWEGDLYPRWLLNMNHGLGSPSLFVYPPLPAYVYALLLPVAKILHLDAFCLGEYLCLLTSGLSAFFWMTTLAGRRVSLVVATLYMLMPYHLAVDFYRRGALAESWALAWIPLVLYFTTQAVRKKRYAIAGLALAYALLIVSHLISVLLFSALPLLLALTIAERGRKARALWTVIGALPWVPLSRLLILCPLSQTQSTSPYPGWEASSTLQKINFLCMARRCLLAIRRRGLFSPLHWSQQIPCCLLRFAASWR